MLSDTVWRFKRISNLIDENGWGSQKRARTNAVSRSWQRLKGQREVIFLSNDAALSDHTHENFRKEKRTQLQTQSLHLSPKLFQ